MVHYKVNRAIGLASFNKRVVLTSKITLFCTVFGMLHFTLDLSQGHWQSALADFTISIAVFGCFILNWNGVHNLAKVAGLLLMNFSMAIYACLVPKEVGVYLFFFPLMTIAASLFEEEERGLRYALIALPFAFLLLLFLTDFSLLGEMALESPANPEFFFLINVISSGLISIICIYFMLKLNEASERELKRLAEEITVKNEDLLRTNAELDRFLYSTSHDLRSPLSSIKGLINVAKYDTSDAKIHSYFDMMTERINRLEFFIKDIIDYSKNTRTAVADESVELGTIIDEIIEQLRFFEGADQIKIMADINVQSPVVIDRARLHIVLSNLLANAIKYHDFNKQERWIKITADAHGHWMDIRVADNGTGISEEHRERVFEMFYRGTLASGGSGLGLYIVKQTVEKLNGKIFLESAVGRGSDFKIQLPVS